MAESGASDVLRGTVPVKGDRVTWLWLGGLALLTLAWQAFSAEMADGGWMASLPTSVVSFVIAYASLSRHWSKWLTVTTLLVTAVSATMLFVTTIRANPSWAQTAVGTVAFVSPCVASTLLLIWWGEYPRTAWQRAAQAGVFALALSPVSMWLSLIAIGGIFGLWL